MERECVVMVPALAPEVRQGMILFKREWASALMEAEIIRDGNVTTHYKVKGVLQGISSGKAVVKLKDGIMVLVPLNCICCKEGI